MFLVKVQFCKISKVRKKNENEFSIGKQILLGFFWYLVLFNSEVHYAVICEPVI